MSHLPAYINLNMKEKHTRKGRMYAGDETVETESCNTYIPGLASVLLCPGILAGRQRLWHLAGRWFRKHPWAAGAAGIGGEYGLKEFLGVWKQRAFETGAGWLAGLTVCDQMLFGFLTFYAGMSPGRCDVRAHHAKGNFGNCGLLLPCFPMDWSTL